MSFSSIKSNIEKILGDCGTPASDFYKDKTIREREITLINQLILTNYTRAIAPLQKLWEDFKQDIPRLLEIKEKIHKTTVVDVDIIVVCSLKKLSSDTPLKASIQALKTAWENFKKLEKSTPFFVAENKDTLLDQIELKIRKSIADLNIILLNLERCNAIESLPKTCLFSPSTEALMLGKEVLIDIQTLEPETHEELMLRLFHSLGTSSGVLTDLILKTSESIQDSHERIRFLAESACALKEHFSIDSSKVADHTWKETQELTFNQELLKYLQGRFKKVFPKIACHAHVILSIKEMEAQEDLFEKNRLRISLIKQALEGSLDEIAKFLAKEVSSFAASLDLESHDRLLLSLLHVLNNSLFCSSNTELVIIKLSLELSSFLLGLECRIQSLIDLIYQFGHGQYYKIGNLARTKVLDPVINISSVELQNRLLNEIYVKLKEISSQVAEEAHLRFLINKLKFASLRGCEETDFFLVRTIVQVMKSFSSNKDTAKKNLLKEEFFASLGISKFWENWKKASSKESAELATLVLKSFLGVRSKKQASQQLF